MLATAGDLPIGPGWSFEFKWDGVRALAVIGRTSLHWYARSGAEITTAYPELAGIRAALAGAGITDAVLDGEIVVFDESGRPSFTVLAERMHVREAGRARALAAALPASYMVFDILSANGTDIRGVPYVERRELLESLAPRLGESGRWIVPPRFGDGPATVAAARELTLEGVVAKRLTSTYRPGVRSPDWVKLKHDQTGEYVVGAWRVGRRELGALLVGTPTAGGLRYRGRVGGGISAAVERDLLARLAELRSDRSPFVGEVPREDLKGASYVEPTLVVEVRYGNVTPDGRLRFPRFVRLRPDRTAAEVDDE
jgi:bifunctional non-homologous end joining protein LigD